MVFNHYYEHIYIPLYKGYIIRKIEQNDNRKLHGMRFKPAILNICV